MGYFCHEGSSRPRRAIGVGAGDIELAAEVMSAQGELVASPAPEAEAVYVCGWCFRIVLRTELNHRDTVSEVCVCDDCASAKNPLTD